MNTANGSSTVCGLVLAVIVSVVALSRAADESKAEPAGFTEVKVFSGCRIPAIVLTRKGTLLAFAEKRNASGDHGPVDLIVSRSSDQGKTWSKPQMIHGGFQYACGNPCPIVDRDTGTVWLLFARNNNKQIMLTHSLHESQVQLDGQVSGHRFQHRWRHNLVGSGGSNRFAATGDSRPRVP